MNVTFVLIVDNIFRIILIFLFNLIWCTYFIKKAFFATALAFFLALLITFIINKLSNNQKIKSKSKLKEQQRIFDITNEFIYMTQSEIVDFFYRLSATRHNCKIQKEFVEIYNENKKIILYPKFETKDFSVGEFIELYKKIKKINASKIIILTNKYDSKIHSEIEKLSLNAQILDYKETYHNLLKPYEFYPEIKIKAKVKPKTSFNYILSIALNKKKTKAYLASALVLFFSSFFVIYKIYYLIISSTLVLLALFSQFNPKFNKIETKNLLE